MYKLSVLKCRKFLIKLFWRQFRSEIRLRESCFDATLSATIFRYNFWGLLFKQENWVDIKNKPIFELWINHNSQYITYKKPQIRSNTHKSQLESKYILEYKSEKYQIKIWRDNFTNLVNIGVVYKNILLNRIITKLLQKVVLGHFIVISDSCLSSLSRIK